ncbi:hypothetical protein K432DRAFT_116471 [Lepidopterella palustris CBS 459.81]|uniref:Uncharacterized protein n=1 Tax=Lepidopterella palustris CBS 459.81 TaxID=1314670 RepID=A0A8E2JCJ7_9PEZI|nr:hypothetical protein K432DRAFT_116471 [Lepidopterella palustris CBS 459.81]
MQWKTQKPIVERSVTVRVASLIMFGSGTREAGGLRNPATARNALTRGAVAVEKPPSTALRPHWHHSLQRHPGETQMPSISWRNTQVHYNLWRRAVAKLYFKVNPWGLCLVGVGTSLVPSPSSNATFARRQCAEGQGRESRDGGEPRLRRSLKLVREMLAGGVRYANLGL